MNLLKTPFRIWSSIPGKTRGTCFLSLLAFALVTAAGPHLLADPDPSKEKPGKESRAALKSYTGTLKTGVMAIGAETTGYTLTTAGDGVYELEFKNPKVKVRADAMDGKSVTVEGIYKPRPGVEVEERRIIEVKKLSAD